MTQMRKFKTGATCDTDEGKLKYLAYESALVNKRFAQYMQHHETQADGVTRKPDNWKLRIPIEVHADSLIRHVEELRLLYETLGTNEDVIERLCAIRFRVNGWMLQLLTDIEPDPSSDNEKWNMGTNGWSYNAINPSSQWPNPED